MKKLGFLLIVMSIINFSSCEEKKNKWEKVGEKIEEAADETDDAVEETSEDVEKESVKAGKKIKKLFNK
jgi:hypothetical protein